MKKIFNSLKTSVKSILSKDPYEKTDLESLYFKKAVAKDLPPESGPKKKTNYVVENKIPALNRTILTGINKKLVEAKVQELVFNNRFNALRPEMKDLCEIVDYACRNNTPVRISYLKVLLPGIEIDEKNILNEQDYEKWLKNKSDNEPIPDDVFKIDDEMGLKEKEFSRRGRRPVAGWNAPKDDNQWKKF